MKTMVYGYPEPDEATEKLAEQIVELLTASHVTYQKADEALAAAQKSIWEKTRPVNV